MGWSELVGLVVLPVVNWSLPHTVRGRGHLAVTNLTRPRRFLLRWILVQHLRCITACIFLGRNADSLLSQVSFTLSLAGFWVQMLGVGVFGVVNVTVYVWKTSKIRLCAG